MTSGGGGKPRRMSPSSPDRERQSCAPNHVTEITQTRPWPMGAKWGAINGPRGATSDLVERSKYAFELASSAASGYVCPVDDAAESFVVGVVVAPDDVPADHAGLLLVAGVVGAVEGEVPQRRELRLDAV